MATRSLSLLLLLALLRSAALAQPIFEWTDEKGQRHFSNFPPAGGKAKELIDNIPTPESRPTIPHPETEVSPFAGSESDENSVSKLPNAGASDEPLVSSDRRWLLIFPQGARPKANEGKPFSGWLPRDIFDTDEACKRARAIWIDNSWIETPDVALVDPQAAGSVCIPASQFISGYAADVIIVAKQFEIETPGFSSIFISGRVFNRGQAAAKNVVMNYKIRSALGSPLLAGNVSTTPFEIPGLAFGEFRTPSIAGWSASELRVEVAIDWSKK